MVELYKKACFIGLIILLGVVSILPGRFVYGQNPLAPDTSWTKIFGGINNDLGYSVAQTFDGGYIVAGYTESFGAGGTDVYLIKTDKGGDTLWTKTYGGINNDYGFSVQQTPDSGYIIIGWTNSFGAGSGDIYLIRTDITGDSLWTKTYGGINAEVANSVQPTADSSYIIVGYTMSFGAGGRDIYLVKTDANGDTLWAKTYGGVDDDYGIEVQPTSDNGYIIVGYTRPSGNEELYLVKTDTNGDTLWTRTYGGPLGEQGYSVQETPDGGYIVAGYTISFGAGGMDLWLLKTDVNGDTLWTKTYGGINNDQGYSVQNTYDGGFIITGWLTSDVTGTYDVYLVKTDANGDSIWTQTWGGFQSDFGHYVQQTSDGRYIITGYTESFGAGGADLWLIKTGFYNDTLWTNTYGGRGDDRGYCVQQTSSSGYIIAGNTNSFGLREADSSDVYLIHTDAGGDTLWTNTYGGAGDDQAMSVQEISGGYIITGFSNSFGSDDYDVYLINTDDNGDTIWTKTYGGAGNDRAYSVQHPAEGGYIICGFSSSFGLGDDDVYLIRTDSNGDTLWTKTYGGTAEDRGYSVQETVDGGYIITGYTTLFGHGDYEVYLIKTDSSGNALWTKTYGGTSDDRSYSVQELTGGGYIICGYSSSFGSGDYDIYLIKTDSNGNIIWTKTYGGTGDDKGYSVQETYAGGYIICGYSNSFGDGDYDVYLITTDTDGRMLTADTYGGEADDLGHSVQSTFDGGYIITGYTNSFGVGGDDVYLIKIEDGGIFSIKEQQTSRDVFFTAHSMPNPFKDQTVIKYALPQSGVVRIVIYNILGQKVRVLKNRQEDAGIHEVIWDGRDRIGREVSSGVYFVRFVVDPVGVVDSIEEKREISSASKLLLIR